MAVQRSPLTLSAAIPILGRRQLPSLRRCRLCYPAVACFPTGDLDLMPLTLGFFPFTPQSQQSIIFLNQDFQLRLQVEQLWMLWLPRFSARASKNWKIKMLYDGECPLCMREVYYKQEQYCFFISLFLRDEGNLSQTREWGGLDDEPTGIFKGVVTTVNNGGFAITRTKDSKDPLRVIDGLLIRARAKQLQDTVGGLISARWDMDQSNGVKEQPVNLIEIQSEYN
nr:uncharacterized protein LOC109165641 [Ipomoea batatas]